ncbi:hypothetical protein DL770_010476 [Monosporascus sp. CRB-9-2]|nr:hypothetical protein DL770_010476 [Monosporascus sp. CRB-9-2]
MARHTCRGATTPGVYSAAMPGREGAAGPQRRRGPPSSWATSSLPGCPESANKGTTTTTAAITRTTAACPSRRTAERTSAASASSAALAGPNRTLWDGCG